MKAIDLAAIAEVANRLKALDVRCVFTGGCVVPLLVDNPALLDVRPTKDVDVIVEVFTRLDYARVEERLRDIGFSHDMSEGAPKCRWIVDDIKVDIMPAHDPTNEWQARWFDVAVETSVDKIVYETEIDVISRPCFIATKIEAFSDRGAGDYVGSHDIEDMIAVIDGCLGLLDEVRACPEHLRRFIAGSINALIQNSAFVEALPGHLPPDEGSQQRLPFVRQQLVRLSNLDHADSGEQGPGSRDRGAGTSETRRYSMTYYEKLITEMGKAMEAHPKSTIAMSAEDFKVIAHGTDPQKVAREIRSGGRDDSGKTTVCFRKPRPTTPWILWRNSR